MSRALNSQQRTGFAYQPLLQFVTGPRATLHIASLAFVLTLPAIAMGMAADDFELALSVVRDPWNAYAFYARDPAERAAAVLAAREAATSPWWIDPQFQQAFLRPLASLSLAVDFALWPRAACIMHIENALLFAAVVWLAAALYRALSLPREHCGLATFFFAMHGAQSMTSGWISGRNTLLATCFGFTCMRLHIHARQNGGTPALVGAIASFGCALLSAEAGLATLAFIVSDALLLDRRPLTSRLRALRGYAALLVGWACLYRLGGYGVKHSGFYLDPVHDPLRYLTNLATAIPIYLASQLTVPFAAASGTAPLALPAITLLSLVILYVSRNLWWPWLQRDVRARYLCLGAVLAVFPLGASMPQDRLVSFVAFGVCGLVACIVQERFAVDNHTLPRTGAARLYRMHAVWATLCYVPWLFGSMVAASGGGAMALDSALPVGDEVRDIVLINAPSHLAVHIFGAMRRFRAQPSPRIDLLYGGMSDIEIYRPDARTLELHVARGYFASTLERIERDPTRRPLHPGDVVSLSRLRARVLHTEAGAPTDVRFEFATDLTAQRFYVWQGRTPRPFSVPSVGARVAVAAVSPM